MQAGNLENAVVAEIADQRLGLGQEEVVVEKIDHRLRMDQQRRVEYAVLGPGQPRQLGFQFGQQFVGRCRCADGVAHLLFDKDALGEGAEIEADDGAFQPEAGALDDGGAFGGVGAGVDFVHGRDFIGAAPFRG